MPKMNGIDAAQEIKKAWKEAVIIGVCAVRDEYIIDTFLKAGADAVISKDSFVQHPGSPLSLKELKKKIVSNGITCWQNTRLMFVMLPMN